MPNQVAILANPSSGSGPNQQNVQKLQACLESLGLTVRTVWTPKQRLEILSDQDLAKHYGCVVVAGGDGSIYDTLNELYAHGNLNAVPMSTFPVGNENLLARHLNISLAPEPLAQAIAACVGEDKRKLPTYETTLDLGLIQDGKQARVFSLMYSVGFDADVVHRLDAWRKKDGQTRRVSKITYAKPTLMAFKAFAIPRIRLIVEPDEQTQTQAQNQGQEKVLEGSHLFIFNTPEYGGKLPIAPQADATDGLLDYVLLTRPSRLGLAQDFAKIVMGSAHLKQACVHHGRAKSLQVQLVDPSRGMQAPAQADGDPAGFAPATVRVMPQALRLIRPVVAG